jgi:pimeloyl-ACP methyl ester carboxylesterase
MIAWYLKQVTMPDDQMSFPFSRVAKAQTEMKHPLGRYLYFIHGYWGMDTEFDNMLSDFHTRGLFDTDYDEDNVRFFDYWEYYGATTQSEKDAVHWLYSVSNFASNFYNELLSIPTGSQVNIIGHSLGGIIAREMLRLHRTDLDNAGISVGKVITLGAPNLGTLLADPLNNWAFIISLIGGLLSNGHLWPSPVFWSMTPLSGLILTLNSNPMSYSSGIEWYTISGYDALPSIALWFIHSDNSDPIVGVGRAHLSFAEKAYFDVSHNVLINDPEGATYGNVSTWITEGPDTDGDELTDDSETYFHGTNPYDSDSDNDDLSDYEEVLTHHTDPNDWDTDGDYISDGNEILWGYDPLNINSPVPATQLISSVDVVGTMVEVLVNHFSAMDYVRFYVKYKPKFGSWTGYYYKGTDYSPNTGEKYRATWIHPSGYTRMMVKIQAFDSSGNWLGTDYETVAISSGGGGGDPPPE